MKNNEKKTYEKIRKQKIHGAYDMSYETNLSDTKIIIFGVVFITSFFLGVAFLVNTIMPWFWILTSSLGKEIVTMDSSVVTAISTAMIFLISNFVCLLVGVCSIIYLSFSVAKKNADFICKSKEKKNEKNHQKSVERKKDILDFSRFHKAQNDNYEIALTEIKNGKKRSHWMWYVFPQLSGLGNSAIAQYYAIADLHEAKEYLKDELLRHHLIEISLELLKLQSNNAQDILGYPDDLKLQSSMTLFSIADPKERVFRDVLNKYYHGEMDEYTLRHLKSEFHD